MIHFGLTELAISLAIYILVNIILFVIACMCYIDRRR